MCQNVNVVMTNRRFVWQKSQGFMAYLMINLDICSHLNYKRTLIQLSLLVPMFILCKPCSMTAALLSSAPSCTVGLLSREITCVGTSVPISAHEPFSLFRFFPCFHKFKQYLISFTFLISCSAFDLQ